MSFEIRLLDAASFILDGGIINEGSHHMKIKAAFGFVDKEFFAVPANDLRQALKDARHNKVLAEAEAAKAVQIETIDAKVKRGVCVETGCTKKAGSSTCDMCEPHFNIASQENEHSDEGHEAEFDSCEKCQAAIAGDLAALKVKKQGAKRSSTRKGIDPMVRYADKIVRVAKTSADGKKVTRVVIKCALPGCKHTREIATQDLFQVNHCSLAHKREHQKQLAGK